MSAPGFRKRTTVILFTLLLVRLWYGQSFDITGHEAYLWLLGYGGNLDYSYFNQGVFLPWFISFGTAFFRDTEMGVRWLCAVIYTCGGFVLFFSVRRFHGAASAFWCLLLFILMPMFAWTLSLMSDATSSIGLMTLVIFLYREAINTAKPWWWLAAGAVSGFAILTLPINAIWLLSLLLFLLVEGRHRDEFLKPGIYLLVVALALVLFLPKILPPIAEQVKSWVHITPPSDDIATNLKPQLGAQESAIGLNAAPTPSVTLATVGAFYLRQLWLLGPAFLVGLIAAVFTSKNLGLLGQRRYIYLLCLAVPGLLVENVLVWFGYGNFEALPALYLPIMIIAGDLFAQLAVRSPRWVTASTAILVVTGIQSLIGLLPMPMDFTMGSGLHMDSSYRQLADEVKQEQISRGAEVLMAGDPETASGLTFYTRPNRVMVPKTGVIRSQFDLWNSEGERHGSALVVMRKGELLSDFILRNFPGTMPEVLLDLPPSHPERKDYDVYILQRKTDELPATTPPQP